MSRVMHATLDATEHVVIELSTGAVSRAEPDKSDGAQSHFEHLGQMTDGERERLNEMIREMKRRRWSARR